MRRTRLAGTVVQWSHLRATLSLGACLVAGCNTAVTGIASTGWVGNDLQGTAGVYEDLMPAIPITLAKASKVTVHFQGEFKPAIRVVTAAGTSTSSGTGGGGGAIVSFGVPVPITLRVLVGGVVASPDELTGGGGSTEAISHGIIAVRDSVPPGPQLIQVQWKSSVAGAHAKNRGIIVFIADAGTR